MNTALRPLASVLAAVAALAGCSRGQGSASTRASHAPLAVRVAPVAVRDVVYEIRALGSLEAQEMVQVTAEVEGAVSDVVFHEGDRVGPGTVLLRIDPERYRLEAERAEAALQQARAEYGRAQADLTRREELAENKLVAQEEMTRSRGENLRLAAAVEAVKAAHAIALQNLRRSEVRPPKAGEINSRTVDTGRYVKAGDVLATLVDTSRLRLRFKLSEGESLRAQVGGEATFRVGAIGSRDFTGRIYHVSGVADPATRQVEVLAWVRNPGVLKPGFFAEVRLAGETRKGAVVVPEGAVQASERGFVTYVVADGRAHARPVKIGLRTGNAEVEILDGVRPGETVVIEGSDTLADGVPVQPAAGVAPSGQKTEKAQ